MSYKIDMEKVLDVPYTTTEEKLKALQDAVTAILYMFEVSKTTIDDEQYKGISDDDKRFFKKS